MEQSFIVKITYAVVGYEVGMSKSPCICHAGFSKEFA